MPIELMVLIKHLGWRKLIMSHPPGVRGRLRRQEGRESFQGWTKDGPLLLLGRRRLWVGDGVWLGLTELREDEELLGGGGQWCQQFLSGQAPGILVILPGVEL